MANKRVSELTQITTGELDSADLFLLSDTSVNESKKLTLSDLSTYILTGGNLTGSFYGTSSWAENAKTSSVSTTAVSASWALTASFALNGGTGGAAVSASWASASLSSSYARTASFVSVANAATASFATSSRFSDSASFLIYTGGNNGTITNAINAVSATTATSASFASTSRTASYALSSSVAAVAATATVATTATSASFATYAQTASVGIVTSVQTSASWASQSLSASVADNAVDAMFAITASYVLPDLTLQQEGIFLAISQSNYRSQLDKVNIVPFFSGPATTSIEAVGTIVAPYTSSITLNETVTLYALGRETGILYEIDASPIYVNIQGQFSGISASVQAALHGQLTGSITGSTQGAIGGTVSGSISGSLVGGFTGSISGSDSIGTITGSVSSSLAAIMAGNYTGSLTSSISASYNGILSGSISGSVQTMLSGAMKIPLTLMGQLYLPTGSYMIFISASTDKIYIEPSRTARFSVASNIGQFGVTSGEVIQLTTTNPADQITFSSSLNGGPFTDTAANIVASGSSDVTFMDVSAVGAIRYVWTCDNLTYLYSNNNIFLNDVQGMPESILTMSLQNGVLNNLYDLSATSASILNVYNNQLTALGDLPATMSYINVSSNPILTLPDIPYGVTQLYCNSLAIENPPDSFTDTIVSMSFNSNPDLSLWLTTLPTSLSSFEVSNCVALTALPTIPANVRYLDVSGDALTDVAQDNICANLVTNGLLSGSLNLLGNASLLPVTLTRIATLQTRAWTVSY